MKRMMIRSEVTVYKPGDTIPANTDVADRTGKYYRWPEAVIAPQTYVAGMIPWHFVWSDVTERAYPPPSPVPTESPRVEVTEVGEDSEEERLQGEINDVLLLLAKRNFLVTRERSLVSQVKDALDEVQSKRNQIAREAADVRDEFASARINWEQEKERLLEEIHEREDLLHNIWLYVSWKYVTKQLTTEQKNLWADAIDMGSGRIVAERWWENDGS
jgi:hypothetical protein